MKRTGKYTPRRLNRYVPAMGYAADVILGGPHEVRFGPMAVASATNLINATAVTTAVAYTTILQDGNTDPVITTVAEEFPYGPGFGRCLQIVFAGANTGVVTLKGRDYLGQPVTENLTANGATPVIGVKAFKYLDSVTAATGGTISVGTTDKLGLPYCTQNVLSEQLDGARVSTLGTLVAPSYVDPATATTTDPRGSYDPNSTLNGTAFLTADIIVRNEINTNGNGGLYGLAHFGS
jgi:hypothetical protein